jgi:hypothetical protein
MSYGRDRGRRLAPPSVISTTQCLFRQALLGTGLEPLALDELFVARSLLERGQALGSLPLGPHPRLHAHAAGSGEAGHASDQTPEEEGAEALATVGVHARESMPR